MIKLIDLTKIYSSGESVGIGIQNINIEFNLGEFVGIIGASGSGKTTLLNIISGMDTYTEGEMLFNGVSTANFNNEELENYRKDNVAFIFQNYQLIDSYTALENVMLQYIIKGMDKKQAKEKAKELLNKVGILNRSNVRASKLSGGEKQRVVIARALASDAKIFACDEPTGNLDEASSKEIMRLIKEVSKDKLVLFVTHDESLIKDNFTRIVKIRDGLIESDVKLVETSPIEVENTISNKVDFNTKLYISTKNLYRTPKKTIFLSLVFLIVSFIIMFAVAYVPLNIVATSNYTIEYTMFNNRDENRIVVYNNNSQNSIDYNLTNAQIYKDDYIFDCNFRAASTSSILNNYLYKESKLHLVKEDITLVAGRFPSEEATNEVLIIFDSSFSTDFYQSILDNNTELRFASDNSTGSFFGDYYKVVGFATKEEIKNKQSLFYLNYEGTKKFIENYKTKIINDKNSDPFISDFSFVCENKKYPVTISDYVGDNEIRVNVGYKNKEYFIYLGNKTIDLSVYDIKYVYNTNFNYVIEMNINTAIKMMDIYLHRTSVYVEDSNLDDTISSLRSNDNLEVYPIVEAKKVIPVYDYNAIFENLFSILFLVIVIIMSILIAILITSFVLKTKKKELGVFRVIGLNQKDVLQVLNLEVLTLMLLSITINILIGFIFKIWMSEFPYTIIFDNIYKLLCSILILILIAFIISIRWNKKMFTLTAREVLRVGE